jgi:hypothetical protein
MDAAEVCPVKLQGIILQVFFSLRERFWMILAILDDIGGFWGHALFRTNPFCLDAAAFDRKPQLKLTRPSQQKSLC